MIIMRKMAPEISVSDRTKWRIMKKYFKLFPYKTHKAQLLCDGNKKYCIRKVAK